MAVVRSKPLCCSLFLLLMTSIATHGCTEAHTRTYARTHTNAPKRQASSKESKYLYYKSIYRIIKIPLLSIHV